MTDWAQVLAAGFAFWVVAATPGPANISNAAIAMRDGRGPSLVYGLGLSVALVFWGVIAATGMGAVLQTSVWLLTLLKVLGAGYLLWLAWQAGHAAARPDVEKPVAQAGGRWFWRGLALNLSNPKSVMAWMAALAIGLDPSAGLAGMLAPFGLCCIAAFANNTMYSLLFSMPGMMTWYRRFRRWIDGVSAALFAVGGLALVRSAVQRGGAGGGP